MSPKPGFNLKLEQIHHAPKKICCWGKLAISQGQEKLPMNENMVAHVSHHRQYPLAAAWIVVTEQGTWQYFFWCNRFVHLKLGRTV